MTATWTGTGKWNGQSGYSFTVIATDSGQRSSHADVHGRRASAAPDRFEITIRNASGVVVFTIAGPVSRGNIVVAPRSGHSGHGGAHRPASR